MHSRVSHMRSWSWIGAWGAFFFSVLGRVSHCETCASTEAYLVCSSAVRGLGAGGLQPLTGLVMGRFSGPSLGGTHPSSSWDDVGSVTVVLVAGVSRACGLEVEDLKEEELECGREESSVCGSVAAGLEGLLVSAMLVPSWGAR